jgi:hypothetical protein
MERLASRCCCCCCCCLIDRRWAAFRRRSAAEMADQRQPYRSIRSIQSIDRSIRSIDRSINQSTDRSIDSIDQSLNQSVNRSIENQSIHPSVGRSIHHSANRSILSPLHRRSIHHSAIQSIYRSAMNQSIGLHRIAASICRSTYLSNRVESIHPSLHPSIISYRIESSQIGSIDLSIYLSIGSADSSICLSSYRISIGSIDPSTSSPPYIVTAIQLDHNLQCKHSYILLQGLDRIGPGQSIDRLIIIHKGPQFDLICASK